MYWSKRIIPVKQNLGDQRRAACLAGRGFTLIELMIALAIMLVLILGVNQVFKMSFDTIGAGQALSAIGRDGRAAETVFRNDFSGMALEDGPFMIICSERASAFKDRQAEMGDRDYATASGAANIDAAIRSNIDLDGDGSETTSALESSPVTAVDDRSHRIDRLAFFARGEFLRQTGNGQDLGAPADTLVAPMSSKEALIWYGHLARPATNLPSGVPALSGLNPGPDMFSAVVCNRSDALYSPCLNAQNNLDNFYARDWTLGRVAVLLKEPDATGLADDNGDGQYYFGRGASAGATSQAPLSVGAGYRIGPPPPFPSAASIIQTHEIQSGRIDLAGTNISNYRKILNTAVTARETSTSSKDYRWWDYYLTDYGYYNQEIRFPGNPKPSLPISASSAAGTVPCFLQNCSHFIVEYAGDFVKQNSSTGAITGVACYSYIDGGGDIVNVYQPGGSDGIIDFYIDNSGTTPVKRIRWYGYPRDIASLASSTAAGKPDRQVHGWTASNGRIPRDMPDVVPLRDVMAEWIIGNITLPSGATYAGSPFERTRVQYPAGVGRLNELPSENDYAAPTSTTAYLNRYVCAWGPDVAPAPKPKLIRIIYTLEDPNGRLAEGQTYEYIFELP